ncbi:uncharacterized protein LOC127137188 [Lathyrus oleraceus]|uniref:uncharacterized protein LOC127137188 n=1 Tax=Pisum sativum TaxID=3888 RepID=UPI0021D1BFFA|nr:uncharacterized protein LOC127137188 [Pisum sativum]
MAFSDARKVMFAHMFVKEAEYWWDDACQRLEVVGTEITWNNFKTEFLEKYFPADVRRNKEIEFLELKQGKMTIEDYATKFKELSRFCLHYNGVGAKDSRVRSAHYKSVSEKKSGHKNHGKPYEYLSDKGKWEASDGKETSRGGVPASVICFSYGWIYHRASECKSFGKKCFRCGKTDTVLLIERVMC